jgi:hypothetical protein
MSSALTIVLMATMAVPGNGPEMVSAKAVEGLDLRGEWSGVVVWLGRARPVVLSGGTLWWRRKGSVELWSIDNIKDDGDGKFRLEWDGYSTNGIYEQRLDTVLMWYSSNSEESAAVFKSGINRLFLILHRVKPRK